MRLLFHVTLWSCMDSGTMWQTLVPCDWHWDHVTDWWDKVMDSRTMWRTGGIMWCTLGPCDGRWDCVTDTRTMWLTLGTCDRLWNHVKDWGTMWQTEGPCDRLWNHVKYCGIMSRILGEYSTGLHYIWTLPNSGENELALGIVHPTWDPPVWFKSELVWNMVGLQCGMQKW